MLTTKQAEELIDLLKCIVEGKFVIPEDGKLEYDFKSTETRDLFKISIFRSKIGNKISYTGLLKGKNVMLIRLDINKNGVHKNPDGEKIIGNHIHIYTEEHSDKYAVNFNVNEFDVKENCIDFFRKFNVINPEFGNSQTTLSLN